MIQVTEFIYIVIMKRSFISKEINFHKSSGLGHVFVIGHDKNKNINN